MPTYLHDSGLFVSEQVSDSESVERALNALDHPVADRLFVTREVDQRFGSWVWRVMIWNGDRPAENLCEWRDQAGQPLPLSHGLVDRVRAQMASRDGDRLGIALAEQNERHSERVRREVDDALDEIAADVGPRMRETRSAVLHRGQHLRRSRQKAVNSGVEEKRRRVADRLRKLAD